jgi:hypothetical protein
VHFSAALETLAAPCPRLESRPVGSRFLTRPRISVRIDVPSRSNRGYDLARVEHFGPFIGLNLSARATHEWVLGPFPGLFESGADVSAHPWPQPSGATDPAHPPHFAEIAVTSLRSQITPAGDRFLVITVQNIGVLPLDGYNVRVTLTSAGARAGGGS